MKGLGVTTAMVTVQFLEVGLNTMLKAAMSKGMSNFVFVVYSNGLAIFVLLLASFIFYRFSLFIFICSNCSIQQLPCHTFYITAFFSSLWLICRKRSLPPLTVSLVCRIFVLGLLRFFSCLIQIIVIRYKWVSIFVFGTINGFLICVQAYTYL